MCRSVPQLKTAERLEAFAETGVKGREPIKLLPSELCLLCVLQSILCQKQRCVRQFQQSHLAAMMAQREVEGAGARLTAEARG